MKDNHKPEIRTNECGYIEIEIGRKSIKSKRPSRKDIGKETDDTSQQATESRIPFSETNEAKWRNRRLEKQHPNQRRK